MRQAISRLFGIKKARGTDPATTAKPSAPSAFGEHRESQHTIDENSDNGIRRQLVQMLLRDGLRKHGIPTGWVECRMLLVNSHSRGPGMYMRLAMRRWDLRLLTYAHVFEEELRATITQFEPEAPSWLHGISWEFDVGDSCPYTAMPDPAVWQKSPAAVPAPAVETTAKAADNAEAEVLRDLERMFAIRDANLRQQAFADTAPVDFQHTEPASRL